MKNPLKILAGVVGVLIIVSLILVFWYPWLEAFRIVFGAAYVLFLPGFVWTYVFFRKEKPDLIERLTFSVAISVALVPVTMFFLNALGMKINFINSFLLVLGLVGLGLIARLFLFHKGKNKAKAS